MAIVMQYCMQLSQLIYLGVTNPGGFVNALSLQPSIASQRWMFFSVTSWTSWMLFVDVCWTVLTTSHNYMLFFAVKTRCLLKSYLFGTTNLQAKFWTRLRLRSFLANTWVLFSTNKACQFFILCWFPMNHHCVPNGYIPTTVWCLPMPCNFAMLDCWPRGITNFWVNSCRHRLFVPSYLFQISWCTGMSLLRHCDKLRFVH